MAKKSFRVAIVIQSGYGAGAEPADGHGAWELTCRLWSNPLFDSHSQVMIFTLPFDAKLGTVVRMIKEFNPDVILHWGHSFGVGVGLITFAAACAAAGLHIDAAICVDPVPKNDTHFLQTEEPFMLPAGVYSCLAFRTLNQPTTFHPWGRPVKSDIPELEIKQIVFGKKVKDGTSPDGRLQTINDDFIDHTNIDDDDKVMELSVAACERAISGGPVPLPMKEASA